jgi:hypothetical protein
MYIYTHARTHTHTHAHTHAHTHTHTHTGTELRYTIRPGDKNQRLYLASSRGTACTAGQRVLVSVDDFKQGTLAEAIDLVEKEVNEKRNLHVSALSICTRPITGNKKNKKDEPQKIISSQVSALASYSTKSPYTKFVTRQCGTIHGQF